MVNAIYTYLASLNQSSKRPVTKYDTHKNAELKTLYNSIIKINKSSPLYLIKPTVDNQLYGLELKEAAIYLEAAFAPLLDNTEESIFFIKKAASSNPDIAEANIITKNYEYLPDSFWIQVHSLASPQQNGSDDIYNNGIGPREGSYTFLINEEEKQHKFQFQISERIKNKEILSQLKDLINNASIGISASIIPGEKENTSRFLLTSNSVGTPRKKPLLFSLEDISPSNQSGIVESYNLNQINTTACNAVFIINGEEKSSLSNQITINNSLQITLKNRSEHPVTINYIPDTEQILSAMKNIVDSYNHLYNLAMSHFSAQNSVRKLVKNLDYIINTHIEELNEIGIYSDENNLLLLDNNIAYSSIIQGEVKNFFSAPNNLIPELLHTSSEIKLNPFEYLEKKVVVYPNTINPKFTNPYVTSMYSGMLFNFYC